MAIWNRRQNRSGSKSCDAHFGAIILNGIPNALRFCHNAKRPFKNHTKLFAQKGVGVGTQTCIGQPVEVNGMPYEQQAEKRVNCSFLIAS